MQSNDQDDRDEDDLYRRGAQHECEGGCVRGRTSSPRASVFEDMPTLRSSDAFADAPRRRHGAIYSLSVAILEMQPQIVRIRRCGAADQMG